jgi:hypothetical protein
MGLSVSSISSKLTISELSIPSAILRKLDDALV